MLLQDNSDSECVIEFGFTDDGKCMYVCGYIIYYFFWPEDISYIIGRD